MTEPLVIQAAPVLPQNSSGEKPLSACILTSASIPNGTGGFGRLTCEPMKRWKNLSQTQHSNRLHGTRD